MGKKKRVKKQGVKGLHLPTLITYAVAGMGVVFIVIFLGFLLVKGGGKKELSQEEKDRFQTIVSQSQKDGILIKTMRDENNKEEGTLLVNEEKWKKLPIDSKEALCFAVSNEIEVKTLLVKNESGEHLGTYRLGGRFFEKK
ncbi:MAG: hypothetical protein GYA35_01755 [Thermoanaerobaculaceae bacterium]|nr:hypothetical protein [Thermoanaerobaculaceae bacterium]